MPKTIKFDSVSVLDDSDQVGHPGLVTSAARACRQTMTRLLETNTDLHRPATEATLAEFLQFAEQTPSYELVYKDLPSAKAVIEAWLDHTA
jgi:hypothetical protein